MAAALEHGAEKAEEQATPPPHFPQVFIPGHFKSIIPHVHIPKELRAKILQVHIAEALEARAQAHARIPPKIEWQSNWRALHNSLPERRVARQQKISACQLLYEGEEPPKATAPGLKVIEYY